MSSPERRVSGFLVRCLVLTWGFFAGPGFSQIFFEEGKQWLAVVNSLQVHATFGPFSLAGALQTLHGKEGQHSTT